MGDGIPITASALGALIEKQINVVNSTAFSNYAAGSERRTQEFTTSAVSTAQRIDAFSDSSEELINSEFIDSEFTDSGFADSEFACGEFADSEFTDDESVTESIDEAPAEELQRFKEGFVRFDEFEQSASGIVHAFTWIPNNNGEIEIATNSDVFSQSEPETCLELFRQELVQNDYRDISDTSFLQNWNENYPSMQMQTERQAFSMFLKMYHYVFVEPSALDQLMSFLKPQHVSVLEKCKRLWTARDVELLHKYEDDIDLCTNVFTYAFDAEVAGDVLKYFNNGGSADALSRASDNMDILQIVTSHNAEQTDKHDLAYQGNAGTTSRPAENKLYRQVAKLLTKHNITDSRLTFLMSHEKNAKLLSLVLKAVLPEQDLRQFLTVLAFADVSATLTDQLPAVKSFNHFWMSVIVQFCTNASDVNVPYDIGHLLVVCKETGTEEMLLESYVFCIGRIVQDVQSCSAKVSLLPNNKGLLLNFTGKDVKLRNNYVCNPSSFESACRDSLFMIEMLPSVLLYNFRACQNLYSKQTTSPMWIGINSFAASSMQSMIQNDMAFSYISANADYVTVLRSNRLQGVLPIISQSITDNPVKSAFNFVFLYLKSLNVLRKSFQQRKLAFFLDKIPDVQMVGEHVPEPFRQLAFKQFMFILDEIADLTADKSVQLVLTDDVIIIRL